MFNYVNLGSKFTVKVRVFSFVNINFNSQLETMLLINYLNFLTHFLN